MKECDCIHSRTQLYLDGELQADERHAFDEHVGRCENCRAWVNSERRFLDIVRQAGPLYETPVDLRNSIEEITSRTRLLNASVLPFAALSGAAKPARQGWFTRFGGIRRVASVSAIGIALTALCILYLRKPGRAPSRIPSEFAVLAVDTHQRHLAGELDLEVASTSPQDVSKWFAGHVSFRVELPNYQEMSGQAQLYRIEGGRVVKFKNDYAAYVSYQMDRQPISLLVTSDSVAPGGGDEIVSKGITFHYDSIDGLKVITWSDRGLTYALVSNLKERGQQSCLVCHQGTKDTDFLEGFNTGPPGTRQWAQTGRASVADHLHQPDRQLPASASD